MLTTVDSFGVVRKSSCKVGSLKDVMGPICSEQASSATSQTSRRQILVTRATSSRLRGEVLMVQSPTGIRMIYPGWRSAAGSKT